MHFFMTFTSENAVKTKVYLHTIYSLKVIEHHILFIFFDFVLMQFLSMAIC